MAIEPLAIGVCSWSLQVKSVPELKRLLDRLGTDVVQLACGDPHHAAWDEGDRLPEAARKAGLRLTGAMLGFPGEDYTTPQTIQKTGGFGDPATRPVQPQRPGQGRQPADDAGHLGRGSAARSGPGPHPPVRPDAEESWLPRPAVRRARGRQPGAARRRHRPRAALPARLPGELTFVGW